MRVTEKAVAAGAKEIAASPLIDAPKLDWPAWCGLSRRILEAAFAAVEVIPGTDVFAAAEKESEVMPPDGQRNVRVNKTKTPATSPGGAIAGASGRFQSAVDSVKLYERVHIELENGKNWTEIDNGMSAEAKGITYENWLAYMEHSFYYILRDVLHELLCPITPPAPSPDEVERALIAFNESWGEFALDGTERCRTAMRAALAAVLATSPGGAIAGASDVPDFGWHTTEHEGVKLTCRYIAPGLTVHDLSRIFAAAEKEAKPGDELRGNPSKWPTMRGINAVKNAILQAVYSAPSAPSLDEVERVARAICSASDCDPDRMIEVQPGSGYSAWGSFTDVARAAIAAMNRAPQPRLRAIRQALAAIGNIAENEAANECSMQRIVDALADPVIVAELSAAGWPRPQSVTNRADFPLNETSISTTPQPSINAEMLAALKETFAWINDECQPFAQYAGQGHNWNMGDDDRKRAQGIIKRARAIIAKASEKAQC